MNTTELNCLIPVVVNAALDAGKLLSGYFQNLDSSQIDAKSSDVDLVSIADRESENLIRERLQEVLPESGFIGEESERGNSTASLSWVVDPLDGTSNYLSGVPIWCVSIALCDSQLLPQLGVVHAPLLGKTWHASRGGGTFLGDKALKVRKSPPGGGMSNAMLATGFPYDINGSLGQTNIRYFCHMQRVFHKIRRLGSAAIDLAYVSEGVFDGMWELALNPWDTAAGMLLVEEAGGVVQRIDGTPYTPGNSDILAASTPKLAEAIRLNLRSARGCPLKISNSD